MPLERTAPLGSNSGLPHLRRFLCAALDTLG
jgi:hypothetical protein